MDVFEAANVPIAFDVIENFTFKDEQQRTKNLLKKNKNLIVGNVGNLGSKFVENTDFYKHLDLFVNIVHCFNLPSIKTRHENIDLIVIKDNLEGEYSGIEHEVYPGVFESIKIITRERSLRLAEYAFEHSFLTGRKKVTAVHKANIMKLADGLFLESCREVAAKYPTIEYEEMIVDNTCMQLSKTPEQFDVMIMPNLYGSIVTSIATGLVGGPGVTAGASLGGEFSLFEHGTRHSGHMIAGKNVVNPSALLFSGVNMLRSNGLPRFGDLISDSVLNVYKEGKVLTPDVGGKSSTSDFTKRVVEEVQKLDGQ